MRCVRVVIGESGGFRSYGSNSCVISRRVRLLSIEDIFSEVVRMGGVFSIRGGLCSDLFSICTIKEMTLAEIKSSSL